MPIIKSAKKRTRQAAKRRGRNLLTKRSLRQTTKALEASLAKKDHKTATKLFSELQGKIDTAVKKHLMHKNKAARIKSRFAAKVKAASTAKRPAKPTTAKKPKSK